MRRIALVTVWLSVLLLPVPAGAVNVGEQITGFCLPDAHGRYHRLSSYHQRILVLWYEGVKSRHQNQWVKQQLAAMLRSGKLKRRNYASVGVANFHETALPGALLESALRKHSQRSSVRVLLDRDGSFRRAWGFHHGRSNIYVLDARRRVIWRSTGPLTRRSARQLVRMIVRRAR